MTADEGSFNLIRSAAAAAVVVVAASVVAGTRTGTEAPGAGAAAAAEEDCFATSSLGVGSVPSFVCPISTPNFSGGFQITKTL